MASVENVLERVKELKARFDKCLGNAKPYSVPCAAPPTLVYSCDGPLVLEVRAASGSISYSEAIKPVVANAFPVSTMVFQQHTLVPLVLNVPAEVGTVLATFIAELTLYSRVEDPTELMVLPTKLMVIGQACTSLEDVIKQFEPLLNGVESNGQLDTGSAQAVSELEHEITSANKLLSRFPQVQEALQPSMRDGMVGPDAQYSNSTVQQLRKKGQKLFQQLKQSHAKLMAQERGYVANKKKQQALGSLVLKLSQKVHHAIQLEVVGERVELYRMATKTLSVQDVNEKLLPELTKAFVVLNSFDGPLAYKHLVHLEHIIGDVLRVMDAALATATISHYANDPSQTELPVVSDTDKDKRTCAQAILDFEELLQTAESMTKDISSDRRQTVPKIEVDGKGRFTLSAKAAQPQAASRSRLKLPVIAAPISDLRAKAQTVQTLQTAMSVTTAARGVLESLQAICSEKITPVAILHYNRLVKLIEWLKQDPVLQNPPPTQKQIRTLLSQLNASALPFSTRVEWARADDAPFVPLVDRVKARFESELGQWLKWEEESWESVIFVVE
eukprot:m.229080 g.229080  ORF g.229080 m.229080 type:complete len:559 (+) comp15203_c0_seq2:50-1726(+)